MSQPRGDARRSPGPRVSPGVSSPLPPQLSIVTPAKTAVYLIMITIISIAMTSIELQEKMKIQILRWVALRLSIKIEMMNKIEVAITASSATC